MKRLLLILSLTALAGCMHGPRLKNFEAAYHPAGVSSTVRVYDRSDALKGELISVEDEAIVLALDRRIVRVPYASIRVATFKGAPHLGIAYRRRPMSENRRQLSLLSRFPQGLSGDFLARLLDSCGQEQIETVP